MQRHVRVNFKCQWRRNNKYTSLFQLWSNAIHVLSSGVWYSFFFLYYSFQGCFDGKNSNSHSLNHSEEEEKNRFINKHIEFGCELLDAWKSCTHSACHIVFGIVCASISFNPLNGTFCLSRSQLNWSHTTQETKLNTKISAFNQYDQDKMVGIDETIVSELSTHTHTPETIRTRDSGKQKLDCQLQCL